MTQKHACILLCTIFFSCTALAQSWKLKISSSVELRTWKLNHKSDKEEKALAGASIKLLNGNKVVTEMSSKPNGDFTIEVPANGDYVLEVSFPGCNTKRFAISTKDVPEKVGTDNFKPSYGIEGFIMAKPFSGIDYSALQNPLLKVIYKDGLQNFDSDDEVTQRGRRSVSRIAESENDLIGKFCDLNKAGDAALNKNDCSLAKSYYEKALALIQGEAYPTAQLLKVADCAKKKEEETKKNTQKDADKKAVDDAVAKAKADQAAKQQAVSDKLAMAAAQNAKQEATQEKAADKKSGSVKPAQETPKTTSENKTPTTAPTPTANGVLKIKPKSEKELKVESKQAKQREGQAKSLAEDRDAMQKDAEKAEQKRKERKKEDAERAQKEREGKAAAEAKIIEEDKAEAAKIQERLQKEREGKAAAEAKIIEEDKAEAAKRQERLQKEREGKAAAEAKIIEEDKAEAAKRQEARLKRQAEEEQERKEELERKKSAPPAELEESELKTPRPLGANKYKETITRADDFFKTKRYTEAKKMYEEALALKAGDTYATSKLAEISKLEQAKP